MGVHHCGISKGRLDCLATNHPSVLSSTKHLAASPTAGNLESKVPDKTHDCARFTDELEEAVQMLKGTATFSTVEAGLAIEIKFTTAGHAEVFGSARSQTSLVPDVSVLSFSFETDQSFLVHTVREVKAIVSRFPVRNT